MRSGGNQETSLEKRKAQTLSARCAKVIDDNLLLREVLRRAAFAYPDLMRFYIEDATARKEKMLESFESYSNEYLDKAEL